MLNLCIPMMPAFHTRSDMSGVKGIIGMHRFNICLVVVLLWCENTIRPIFHCSDPEQCAVIDKNVLFLY